MTGQNKNQIAPFVAISKGIVVDQRTADTRPAINAIPWRDWVFAGGGEALERAFRQHCPDARQHQARTR